ncbi:MAG: DUF2285 domain-containing protein [Hyphomicrobiales bacterium]|nr:DUF2285 domain-containing protein [Hyphomicrobiales bacterium]
MATNKPVYLDKPPNCQSVTEYDRGHFKLYLQLLHAAADDADWREVVTMLFGINPDQEPQRARKIYDQHLARARWMTTTGYRQLL